MPGSFPFQPPPPPQLGPQWSVWIVIVAVLLIVVAVFGLYFVAG
jgi:hypothetical protein